MSPAYAIAWLLAAAATTPSPPAAADRARSLVEAHRADEALPLLEAARAAAPEDGEVAYLLSRALLEGSGAAAALDRATELAEEAVRRDPASARFHHQLGSAYARKAMAGPFSAVRFARRVEQAFERAAALEPAWIQAHQSLLGFRLIAPRLLGGSQDRAAGEARTIERLDPLLGAMAWLAVHHARKAWPDFERTALAAAPLAVATAHRRQLLALVRVAGYPVEDDGTLGPLWLVALPPRGEASAGTAETWAAAQASFSQAVALAEEAPAAPAPPAAIEPDPAPVARKVAAGKAGASRARKRRASAVPAAPKV